MCNMIVSGCDADMTTQAEKTALQRLLSVCQRNADARDDVPQTHSNMRCGKICAFVVVVVVVVVVVEDGSHTILAWPTDLRNLMAELHYVMSLQRRITSYIPL